MPDVSDNPQANTDRELWRERPDDYYADSIHVTESGAIGMNVGGFVIVLPIREWHRRAQDGADALTLRDALRAPAGEERTTDKSCPCEWVTPCSPDCSCADPYMSGGCERCCRYGSPEQRLAHAKALVGEERSEPSEQAIAAAREAFETRLSGQVAGHGTGRRILAALIAAYAVDRVGRPTDEQ